MCLLLPLVNAINHTLVLHVAPVRLLCACDLTCDIRDLDPRSTPHARRLRLGKLLLLHLGPISAKTQPPLKRGGAVSFPAFGFRRPEQKNWVGLEPEAPKMPSDLKQKKREGRTFPDLKWLGVGQNEQAGGR